VVSRRCGVSALWVRCRDPSDRAALIGMPKHNHTELNCSPDGPWLTLRSGANSLTLNLREIIRGEMFAAGSSGMKRTMAGWLKERDAECKQEPFKDPPKRNERRPAPKSGGRIPASRLIPPPKARGE